MEINKTAHSIETREYSIITSSKELTEKVGEILENRSTEGQILMYSSVLNQLSKKKILKRKLVRKPRKWDL